MFFNLILLNRQHRARFGLAWVAATRGVQHLNRRDVLELDIAKLCAEIEQYVCSESDSPRSRFSLRLSATLVNGTVKIYRQQASFVLEDLFKILTNVVRPVEISFILPVLFGTPPSPVLKTKSKKRRKPEKSTPQSQLEKIVADIKAQETDLVTVPISGKELAGLQARAEEITLRDTQLQSHVGMEVEEFGALGAFQPTDEDFLREGALSLPQPPLESGEEMVRQSIESQPVAPVVIPKGSIDEKLLRKPISSSSSSELDIGPVHITVQAQIHVSATPLPQTELVPQSIILSPVVSTVPTLEDKNSEILVEKYPIKKKMVLGEMQVAAVEARDQHVQIQKGKKRQNENLDKVLITSKKSRIVRINRCGPDEVDWIDTNPCCLPEFKLKIPNLSYLLNLYMVRDDRDLQGRQKISEGSLGQSLTIRKKSGLVTPPVEISSEAKVTPQVLEERIFLSEMQATSETSQLRERLETAPLPLMASTPFPPITLPDVGLKTVEEVIAEPAEEKIISPRKRRRLFDVEDVHMESGLRELPSTTPMTTQAITYSFRLPEKDRHQDIVNKVFTTGRSTLAEVCEKPVTRLHIARAFNDVLVLSRFGYVNLVPENNSIELEYIEKGPKMFA